MAQLDQDIHAWLSRYLNGEVDLAELQAWFASSAWQCDSDLGDDVALLLAEYSSGDRSADELRAEFAGLVGRSIVLDGSLAFSHSVTVAAACAPRILSGSLAHGTHTRAAYDAAPSEAQPTSPVHGPIVPA